VLLAVSSAAADEVHFDPDSPAGKEYALPLTQAREEGSGGGEPGIRRGGGSEEVARDGAPPGAVSLFGVGVGNKSGSSRNSGNASQNDETGSAGATGDASGEAPQEQAALVRSADSGDGYPFLGGALLVAAVVLLGVGLGIGLRSLERVTAR
jgi:hypothetical protein